MIRGSYVLFSIVIGLLILCIVLYKNSWSKSNAFQERVNHVNSVLLMLSAVENMTHTAIQNRSSSDDSTAHGTGIDEINPILDSLKKTVLYDEQRLRIDTLQTYINNTSLPQYTIFNADKRLTINESETKILSLIHRAQQYASWRLLEQKSNYEKQQDAMNLWVNGILILSFSLLAVGLFSTATQSRDKKRLKAIHETILSNASIGICVYEAVRTGPTITEFKITYANEGAIILSSLTEKELISLVNNMSGPAPVIIDRFKEVLQSGKSHRLEASYNFHGHPIWYIIDINKVSAESVAIYFQDITQLKSYEASLDLSVQQLKKVNKDLEQFAHATSHDLQEPFRKIKLMADMILQHHNKESEEQYLETIIRSSGRGLQFVQEVLKYSKVAFGETEFKEVDLNDVASSVMDDLDFMIQEKKAKLTVSRMPILRANYIQMIQLFTNLISNALKFSSADRTPDISVHCQVITADEIKLSSLSSAYEYYLITFRDNGIGFEEGFKDTIFNTFKRLNNVTEFPGFGIGLSLSQRIVLNHQGAITASSVYGAGSTFYVYLPKRM